MGNDGRVEGGNTGVRLAPGSLGAAKQAFAEYLVNRVRLGQLLYTVRLAAAQKKDQQALSQASHGRHIPRAQVAALLNHFGINFSTLSPKALEALCRELTGQIQHEKRLKELYSAVGRNDAEALKSELMRIQDDAEVMAVLETKAKVAIVEILEAGRRAKATSADSAMGGFETTDMQKPQKNTLTCTPESIQKQHEEAKQQVETLTAAAETDEEKFAVTKAEQALNRIEASPAERAGIASLAQKLDHEITRSNQANLEQHAPADYRPFKPTLYIVAAMMGTDPAEEDHSSRDLSPFIDVLVGLAREIRTNADVKSNSDLCAITQIAELLAVTSQDTNVGGGEGVPTTPYPFLAASIAPSPDSDSDSPLRHLGG